MEPPAELVKKVAQAIGDIMTNNSQPLRGELSSWLIERIAAEAAQVVLDWLEFKQ